MRDFDPELSIEVKGKERIVRLPGSNYLVTYFKREGSTTTAYALHFGSVTRKDMRPETVKRAGSKGRRSCQA
jgi:hypothetical protein